MREPLQVKGAAVVSAKVLAIAGSIVAGAAPAGAEGDVMAALAHAAQQGMDTTTYEHLVYNPVTDRVLYLRNGDGLSVRDPANLAETTTVAARYSGNTWPGQLLVDPRNGWVYQSTRRSAGRLNLLVPGADGSMTVQPLGADGHNLPLPATSLWRMAIEPTTGALHIATARASLRPPRPSQSRSPSRAGTCPDRSPTSATTAGTGSAATISAGHLWSSAPCPDKP